MLRKNVAGQHIGLGLVNATTGAALTGATVGVFRIIDGGTQAAATGAVTEGALANGQYSFAPSQADTNGNQISYLFTATNAIPVEKTVVTTAADPTDAAAFGLTRLDAAVTSRSTYAGADTAGTTTLLSRLTSGRAGNLDNLDAAVSTRSVYAGADTAGTTTLLARVPATFPANFAALAVDTSGRVTLAPAGLDAVVIEAGLNARQALAIAGAAGAGALTGQDTNAPVLKGMGVSTTRITMVTDANGNRSSVVLTPPA